MRTIRAGIVRSSIAQSAKRTLSNRLHGSHHVALALYNVAMAYIPYIEEHDASLELKALYDRYRDPAGHVDNVVRIHGANPPSLKAHLELYATLMRGRSDLSRAQREMIAVVVSSINECHY